MNIDTNNRAELRSAMKICIEQKIAVKVDDKEAIKTSGTKACKTEL